MDIVDGEVPIEWFCEALNSVRVCQNLDFLLVTKRPELFGARTTDAMRYLEDENPGTLQGLWEWILDWVTSEKIPQNVWIITSTENQEMLEKRVPHLLRIPALIHGLSCEPLLEGLDLRCLDVRYVGGVGPSTIDWVIAGSESGPNARQCQVEWLRSIQQQCDAAGVAYFCKQLGANVLHTIAGKPGTEYTITLKDKKGGTMEEWPDAAMRVRQWPETKTVPATTP
jgi:hypothetical protein